MSQLAALRPTAPAARADAREQRVDAQELQPFTNVARDVVQILAILLGGLWTYLKFVRGRTFRRRGELDVTGQLYTFDDEPALVVKVTFKNTGLSRIKVPEDQPPHVLVTHVETGGWREGAATWSPPDFTSVTPGQHKDAAPPVPPDSVRSTATMLTRHQWVEPGETIADEQVVVPPAEQGARFAVAYRIQAILSTAEGWLGRRPIFWTAYAVVPGVWMTEAAAPASDGSHGQTT